MSKGNKIMLLVGLGTAALIGILVVINLAVAPEGLVVDPDATMSTADDRDTAPLQWVPGAHHPVIEVTDATFASAVLGSDRPVLVDFWATWCGPCVEMAPVVEQFAEQHTDVLRVAKLDVDQNPQTAREYQIDALPTLVLFRDGEEVERIIGLTSLDDLVDRIEGRFDQPAAPQ